MQIVKKSLSIILRISISIFLLIFLFRQKELNLKLIWGTIKNAEIKFLILAFIIFFFNYLLCFFRWGMLIRHFKIDISFKRLLISFAGSHFFNVLLPSTIGGDLVRSMDLTMHTKKPKEIVATVFLDRLSGYVGLTLVVLATLIFGWQLIQDKSVFISIAVIVGLLILILLVLFNPVLYSIINKIFHSAFLGRLGQTIRDLHQEIHIFRYHKRTILNNLILSSLIQVIPPIVFYFIALSLEIKLNIIYFFIFLPIIGVITLLPISIGGLGLRENMVVFFFSKIGLSYDLALAMSILSFFFILIYAGLGGIIYVLTVHHRRI